MDEETSNDDEYVDYDTMSFRYRILEETIAEQTGELIGDIEKRIRRELREETEAWYRNIYNQMIEEQQERNQRLSERVLDFLAGPDLKEYQRWYLRWVVGFLGRDSTSDFPDYERLVHEFIGYYPQLRAAGYRTDFIREALESAGFYVGDEELGELPELPEG